MLSCVQGGLVVQWLGRRTYDQQVRLPAVRCRLSRQLEWVNLWADKPSRYVTGHLGQLSLSSPGVVKQSGEQSCQISPRSDLKRQSFRGFFEEVVPTKRTARTQEEQSE